MTYYANSKQVLHGKAHVCDAVDEAWAARIVGALNAPDRMADHLDAEAARRPRRRQFTRGIMFAAQEVRARFWEDGNG